LGFQSLDAHTVPPNAMGRGQATPSKTPVPAAAAPNGGAHVDSSPDFRFRFKSPFSTRKNSNQDDATLSPSSRNILRDAGISGTPGGGSRALFGKQYPIVELEGLRTMIRCDAFASSTGHLLLTVTQVPANGLPR
jgi:hypothetical protein